MHETEEISLADVVRFFMSWWKLIVVCGIAGVLAAWFHLKGVPATFEAQTIVAMAQVPVGITPSGSVDNNFTDVETPALLVERISMPTTFSPSAVKACGFSTSAELMGRFRVVAHNNTNSTLRFAVRHSSPELAERCVNAVVDMIREQQAALARPVIVRLEKALNGMLAPPASEIGAAAEPAGTVEWGSETIKIVLAVRQLRQALTAETGTRMLAPVHAPEQPVPTARKQLLLSWGAAGTFLGLLVALLWMLVTRFRSIAA